MKKRIVSTLGAMRLFDVGMDESIEDILFKICGVFVIINNVYLKKAWNQYSDAEKTAHLALCCVALDHIGRESLDLPFERTVQPYLDRITESSAADGKLTARAVKAFHAFTSSKPAANIEVLQVTPAIIGKSVMSWLNTGEKKHLDILPAATFTQIINYV
jgi:hypothetical protein